MILVWWFSDSRRTTRHDNAQCLHNKRLLTLGIANITSIINLDAILCSSYHHLERQELTKHTIVDGLYLLGYMSFAVMLYAISTFFTNGRML